MSHGKLIIFSAPSGSGKTTLVHYLLSKLELKLAFSVSAASRAKRPNEENGKDYYFLSPDEFRSRIARGDFLEWEEVYENQYYGTLRSEIDRIHSEGKTVIFDVDVVGGLNIKKQFGDAALAVFVKPPSVKELESRLKRRDTESDESLAKRVAKAEEELTYAGRFDVILVNDELQKAKKEAYQLVADFIQ
ncbi:MAG: guanylate kinase [Flavobacteriales bacterium]|nr:guanylate kinase [Flavobacteriales bacterium]